MRQCRRARSIRDLLNTLDEGEKITAQKTPSIMRPEVGGREEQTEYGQKEDQRYLLKRAATRHLESIVVGLQ